MPHPTRRAFCPRCDRFVFAGVRAFAIRPHAVAAALTPGAWVPVPLPAALWHGLTAGGYRCPNCTGHGPRDAAQIRDDVQGIAWLMTTLAAPLEVLMPNDRPAAADPAPANHKPGRRARR